MPSMDRPTLQLAAYVAICRRSCDLLRAALALGMNPARRYDWYTGECMISSSPLDHARDLGWSEGLALLQTRH